MTATPPGDAPPAHLAERVQTGLSAMPLVAILRGVRPDEVDAIADVLVEAGVRAIEVPLNSPEPFDSIARLAKRFAGSPILCGAGTVVRVEDVARLADIGAEIVVTPNADPAVIGASLRAGMMPFPGFLSPSEMFAAYLAGARWLKLFPASSVGLSHFKAISAVLPGDARVLAVGGVGAQNLAEWMQAGAAGAGIGSEIYAKGASPAEVSARARALTAAVRQAGLAR